MIEGALNGMCRHDQVHQNEPELIDVETLFRPKQQRVS